MQSLFVKHYSFANVDKSEKVDVGIKYFATELKSLEIKCKSTDISPSQCPLSGCIIFLKNVYEMNVHFYILYI